MRTVPEVVERQLEDLRKEVARVDDFNRADQAEIVRLQNLIVDRSEKGALVAQRLRDIEKVVGAFMAEEPVAEIPQETEAEEALNPTKRDRVLATLREAARPMKGKEVAEVLKDMNERTVTSYLTYLKRDHLVVHDPMAATYTARPPA